MTTSQKLISDCDEQIEKLQRLKSTITEHAEFMDKFSPASSVGTGTGECVYLHDPPPDVKDLCRMIGGRWEKERASHAPVINYRMSGFISWCIFNAEKLPPAEELVL